MIKIYNTNVETNKTAEQEEIKKGCWINMVSPTEKEIKRVCEETNISDDFIRYSLDYEEKARIDIEDDGTIVRQYYPPFWMSGGSVWFDGDWMDHTEYGDWVYDEALEDYPEFDEEDIEELMRVFNENVPQGCCGGCI